MILFQQILEEFMRLTNHVPFPDPHLPYIFVAKGCLEILVSGVSSCLVGWNLIIKASCVEASTIHFVIAISVSVEDQV